MVASLSGNGDQGQGLLFARVGQREKHHHEGESALGLEVAVVDPEPAIPVIDADKGLGWD